MQTLLWSLRGSEGSGAGMTQGLFGVAGWALRLGGWEERCERRED